MNNQQYPKVAIIVLNWNNYEDTKECLNSIKKVEYPNYIVIVVDNFSANDSTLKIEKEFVDDNFVYLYNNENLGYAGGNNVGIKYALSHGIENFLVLNNDTVVGTNFINHLIDLLLSDLKIGVVGPILYFYNTNQFQAVGGWVNFFRAGFAGNMEGVFDIGQFKNPYKVNYITGACLLFKKEVINTIGLFNEDFFLYVEESDWCKRARKFGWHLYIEPKAKVWHKVAISSGGKGSPFVDYYESRNFLYFIERNFPLLIIPEFFLSFCFRIMPKIIRRQWARLRYAFFGHIHYLLRIKGKQEKIFLIK